MIILFGYEYRGSETQIEVKKYKIKSSPVNAKHLYSICTMLDQRRRRWAGVVQMLYKCFVFAGNVLSASSGITNTLTLTLHHDVNNI